MTWRPQTMLASAFGHYLGCFKFLDTTGFCAVPVDELGYGMVVGTLTAFGGKAVQDRRFGPFEIGKREGSFRG